MAKQLNVNLNINANADKAKQQINELVQALQKVSASPITFGDAAANDLKKASQAAMELQHHLQQAVDVNTGQLDLTRFQTSLAKSNQTLSSFQATLMSAGTEGQQAFLKLASAIASAQAPTTRLNKSLMEMGTVLKNTIKWQISSSLIHGFIGTVQSAVGYAEKLNTSLNNIRIVTGKSTEEMAAFAKQANIAAKNLSSSTLDYTNASLIYYQQGIRDQAEIAERTAVTVKLANVSRQSAEEVSTQMTAIWNNFDDGSKSLEYYADVITALGAATASSSSEIATGLEKFAAVADTVGLSYEKATAALATVVAETRQSADVVGTAFKTMFARVQGLTLGETLEDGVTLNKYSKALQTVGVNILTANGNLKEMDTILDELGNKWNTISEAQKVALAETVAGTRQYAQFMAIMNNYDKILSNQELGASSEGALQEQAAIYAQSWEAASERVQNSLEKIYHSLIDDKIAIGFLNTIDKILVGVGGLVEGLGGLKGILFMIGSYVTSHFSKEIPSLLSSITANLINMTSAGEKAAIAMQKTSADSLMKQFYTGGKDVELDTKIEGIAKVAQMNAKLIANQKNLTAEERAYAEIQIENVKLGYEMAAAAAKEAQALNEKAKSLQDSISAEVSQNSSNILEQNELESDTAALQIQEQQEELLQRHLSLRQQIAQAAQNGEDTSILERQLQRVSNEMSRLEMQFNGLQSGATVTRTALKGLFSETTEDTSKVNAKVQSLMRSLQGGEKAQSNAMKQINAEIQKLIPKYKAAEQQVGAWKEKTDSLGSVNGKVLTESQEDIDEYKQKIIELISVVPEDNPLRKNIEKTLETLKQGSDATDAVKNIRLDLEALFNSGDISSRADALRNILLALVPPEAREQILSFGQAARESGVGMEQLKGSTDGIGPKMEEFAEHSQHVSEALGQLSSVFMGFQSLLNSAKRIKDVFNDEDASGIEKISAVLGGLISFTMIYNTMLKNNLIQNLAKAIQARAAHRLALKLEKQGIDQNTIATRANAAAAWAHPVIAIIAAAVLATIAVVTILTDKLKANTEAIEKNASQAKEVYNKTKAQADANKDLISSMQDLLEEYKKDKSKKEELDKVTRQLAEAYGLEGAALAGLTGSENGYQKFLDQAIKKQRQELQDVRDAAKENLDAQADNLSMKVRQGKHAEEIEYDVHVDTQGNRHAKVYNATQFRGYGADDQKVKQYLLDQGLVKEGTLAGQSVQLAYDPNDANSVLEYYNKLLEIKHALASDEAPSNAITSGIATELDAEIARMQEVVADYKNAVADYNEATAAAELAEAADKNEIKNYDDYLKVKEKTIKTLVDSGEKDEDAIKGWSQAVSNDLDPVIQKYGQLDNILQEINQHIPEDKKQEVQSMFENSIGENPEYSTEALSLVNWNRGMSQGQDWTNAITAQAELAQKYIDTKNAALEAANGIDAATNAQEKFSKITSSGITSDEYRSFETESGIKWGEQTEWSTEPIIKYSEFLLKTKEEQTQYLQKLNSDAENAFMEETKDAIEAKKALLASYQKDMLVGLGSPELKETIDNLIKEIESDQEKLDIYLVLQEKAFLDQLDELINGKYEIGATISIDSTEALEKLGLDLNNILTPNGDGTYSLIISSVELQDQIKNATLNKLAEYAGRGATAAWSDEEKSEYAELKQFALDNAENFADLNQIAATGALDVDDYANAFAKLDAKLDLQNVDPKELKDYTKYLQDSAKNSQLLSDSLEENDEAAKIVAKSIIKMNSGIEKLSKGLKDWKDILVKSDKSSKEYYDSIEGIRDACADLLDISGEDLPKSFLTNANNLDLMEKAATGDADAINQLRNNLRDEIVGDFIINHDDMSELADQYAELKNWIENNPVGAELDNSDFINSLNQMLAAGETTVAEVNRIFDSMGLEANFETQEVKQPVRIPITTVTETWTPGVTTKGEDGSLHTNWTKTTATNTTYEEADGVMSAFGVEYASTETGAGIPQISGVTKKATGSFNNSSSLNAGKTGSGGGGGGTKAASHQHSVNRYSNEEILVKGLSNNYDRLSTAKDHAFGAERIRLMEKELSTLGKLKDASGAYLEAIVGKGNVDKVVQAVYSGRNIGQMIKSGALGGTIAADYASLFSGKDASGKNLEYSVKDAAGNEKLISEEYSLANLNSLFGSAINIALDSYGNILNKDALLDTIEELSNTEADAYAAIASATAEQENDHNKKNAYLEALKERLEQYEETADLIEEKVSDYLDKIYELQALNAEKISHELEVNNELTERGLQQIQNAIKLLGNKIYRNAEAMSIWFDKNITERRSLYANRASNAQASMADAMNRWELWAAPNGQFNPEGINSEQAISILDSAKDTIQSAFDDIFDELSEMQDLFGNTLDYWNDKIEKITSAIESNSNSLGHLQNVLGLLGRETDYKALGIILGGQLSNAQSSYDVARAKANASTESYNEALAYYRTLFGENAEWYKENVLDKAEAQMLEDIASKEAALENTLEKVNAWYENEINRVYQESERRLTGKWGSFDALDAAMQRQHNLADEYLTKTNQLYETNALLRKLSQDIDKTDNIAAKAKIKAFSEEIELMKEQEKLSKTDLEIAKARYEVLLAQIALEEAQNAKSTVRLQRDSEGNYGYVYTADQDKINDAEQNLADKQNDLYNLVLGQAQDYTEKIIQHTKERNAELNELNRDMFETDAQYQQARQDIINKYNALIEADYQSHYTAVYWLNQVGAEGQTEAWTDSFSDILYSQDEFATKLKEETTAIVSDVDNQLSWLDKQRAYYTDEAKVGNEELKETVDYLTESTEELAKQLIGKNGLIEGMQNATSAAEGLTYQFGLQYDALMQTAEGYAALIGEIDRYYNKIATYQRQEEEINDEENIPEETKSTPSETVTESSSWPPSSGDTVSWDGVAPDRVFHVNGESYAWGTPEADLLQSILNRRISENKVNWNNRSFVFRSGGYTGDWIGDTGKLAFLHQKELVLNSEDTQNLLSAVALIREISSAIDLRAAASSLSGVSSPFYGATGQILEQQVTIHAEFPNATNHSEIEEAFNTLINRASQFANRTNR